MTIEEYKAQYPQSEVFVTEHDAITNVTTTRNMTDEEYEQWCKDCVEYANNNPVTE